MITDFYACIKDQVSSIQHLACGLFNFFAVLRDLRGCSLFACPVRKEAGNLYATPFTMNCLAYIRLKLMV